MFAIYYTHHLHSTVIFTLIYINRLMVYGYLWHGPGNGEDDGQGHEAVVEAEDADEEEDLEEG